MYLFIKRYYIIHSFQFNGKKIAHNINQLDHKGALSN